MKDILIRIKNRARKLLWLIILLPLITGVIGYIFEAQKPVTYTAEARISLGNFENVRLTDQKHVSNYLKTVEFIDRPEGIFNQIKDLPDLVSINKDSSKLQAVISKLQVTPFSTRMIDLSYTSNDKNSGEKILNLVMDQFIDESDELFNRKFNEYTKQLEDTERINAEGNPLAASIKQTNIETVSTKVMDLFKSEIKNPVNVTVNQPNPMNRAILGFLLGIMVNIIILVTPEIFREEKIRD